MNDRFRRFAFCFVKLEGVNLRVYSKAFWRNQLLQPIGVWLHASVLRVYPACRQSFHMDGSVDIGNFLRKSCNQSSVFLTGGKFKHHSGQGASLFICLMDKQFAGKGLIDHPLNLHGFVLCPCILKFQRLCRPVIIRRFYF